MEIRKALKTAIAIMDDKGRSDGENKMLWERDWKYLRELLLTSLDSIVDDSDVVIAVEQNIDVVSGSFVGVQVDFL